MQECSFFISHSKNSTSSTKKYAIMLPSVSLYSGPIHIAARRVFPCWNIASLLAITNVAALLAMGCLQPVCILCAALIYFGETTNIKCLCRMLTWCVQRQMSLAILGVDREEVSEGTAQALKDTFISVSFGKGCSKNARRKVGGRQRGEGRRESKKPKMKSIFFTVVSSEAFLTDNC